MALSIEQVKSRLPEHIKLVEETYVKVDAICIFIDEEFGKFPAKPKNIISATKNHPKRTARLRKERMVTPIKSVVERLAKIMPNVTIAESTFYLP